MLGFSFLPSITLPCHAKETPGGPPGNGSTPRSLSGGTSWEVASQCTQECRAGNRLQRKERIVSRRAAEKDAGQSAFWPSALHSDSVPLAFVAWGVEENLSSRASTTSNSVGGFATLSSCVTNSAGTRWFACNEINRCQ